MKIKVVGVGHTLGGDDFVGVKVVEEMANSFNDPNVEFHTTVDPSRILTLLEDSDLVVVVDAVLGEKAGEIVVVDSGRYPARLKLISSHGFDVISVIEIAKRLGLGPEKIKVIGVTIEKVTMFSDKISEEVEKAIPNAIGLIKGIIEEWKKKASDGTRTRNPWSHSPML